MWLETQMSSDEDFVISLQFNYYTKRVTLGLVYGSTELFMVQDKSEDFEKTWKFLDRRLENLGQFGKSIRQVDIASQFSYIV